jgi:peptidoglycan-associated lipoprotein|uniref:OmpA family protein n=1 Tax=candidate division WOR-3 bacterium TaxID=2052148 RepID=A0A7V3VTS1_UNCW3
MFFGCPKKQVVKPVEPAPEETTTVVVPKETTVVETRPQLVLERIFFDFDKSDIRQDAAEILKKNAEMLKIYPEVKVLIEGHTCEIGTAEYNMALGERRAKSARDYLIMLGISPDRLSTISYGEERPLDPKVLWKNRRCEFVIMK